MQVNFCRTGFIKSVLWFSLKMAGVESCSQICRIKASENVVWEHILQAEIAPKYIKADSVHRMKLLSPCTVVTYVNPKGESAKCF